MLTKKEIRRIIELLGQEIIVPKSEAFPFTIVESSRGGYADGDNGRLHVGGGA